MAQISSKDEKLIIILKLRTILSTNYVVASFEFLQED